VIYALTKDAWITKNAGGRNIEMGKKQSQFEKVYKKISSDYFITRNWALNRRITRLSSYIYDLRGTGMKIDSEYFRTKNGIDYIYRLK
jgi:hypothetical protein